MKNIFILFLLTIICIGASAQSNDGGGSTYTNAIGIKFYPGGITFKHFLSEKNAVEALGYFYNRGTRITALYELHNDIEQVENLRWYVGPGAHVGLFNSNYGGGISLGLDGVLGLDYKLADAPLNFSLDLQPSLDLAKYSGANRLSIWGGIGARYTF